MLFLRPSDVANREKQFTKSYVRFRTPVGIYPITSLTIKRELKRRRAIEPVIGHMKSDGKLERNWLAGTHGDAVKVLLVAAGHNFRLLLN